MKEIEGHRQSPAPRARAFPDAEAGGPGAPGDAALIRGVAAGEERAFRTLFDRWAPRLGRFLLRVAGSQEAAEDLLQEAFVRIARAAPRFEPRGSVGAWMYRICANLAYSRWRRQHRRARELAYDPPALANLSAASADDPGQERLTHAFFADVSRALEQLSRNHRLVFLLKVQEGLTYAEIGEVLRCPEGTAKSRFHYATRQLRAVLREWRPHDRPAAGPLGRQPAERHSPKRRPWEVQP